MLLFTSGSSNLKSEAERPQRDGVVAVLFRKEESDLALFCPVRGWAICQDWPPLRLFSFSRPCGVERSCLKTKPHPVEQVGRMRIATLNPAPPGECSVVNILPIRAGVK